jgi:predicted ester cyclase
MSAQMKAAAGRFMQEVVSEGRLDVISELVAEDFVEHETMPGMPEGREAVGWFVTGFRSGVPDLRAEVDDLIDEGDKLAVRSTWSGTQEGELFGMPATGKRFAITVIDIVRFEGDKAVEHWGVTDVAGLMEQVGLAS